MSISRLARVKLSLTAEGYAGKELIAELADYVDNAQYWYMTARNIVAFSEPGAFQIDEINYALIGIQSITK